MVIRSRAIRDGGDPLPRRFGQLAEMLEQRGDVISQMLLAKPPLYREPWPIGHAPERVVGLDGLRHLVGCRHEVGLASGPGPTGPDVVRLAQDPGGKATDVHDSHTSRDGRRMKPEGVVLGVGDGRARPLDQARNGGGKRPPPVRTARASHWLSCSSACGRRPAGRAGRGDGPLLAGRPRGCATSRRSSSPTSESRCSCTRTVLGWRPTARPAPAWSRDGAARASAWNRRARIDWARTSSSAIGGRSISARPSRGGLTIFFPDVREKGRGIWQDARQPRDRHSFSSERSDGGRSSAAAAAGLQGVDPGGRPGRARAGSSSSACSPTARTWRTRRCPSASSMRRAASLYTGSDISKGQQVFLHNGLMEYGSAFGHGAYLGPDFTADYLRRSSDLVKRSYGGPRLGLRRAPDDRGLPHQPLRQAHEDADAHRAAGAGLPRARAVLQPLLLRPDDRARPAAQRDHRPRRSCAS